MVALLLLALPGCQFLQATVDDTAADAASCASTPLPPRQLRLLTRAEYAATVRDLFDGQRSEPAGEACATDLDCVVEAESCVDAVCTDDPCTRATFVLHGYGTSGSVVVAGDFNGWTYTADTGALVLQHDATADLWYGKIDLAAGSFAYKFVLDGTTWLTDPANPSTVDDGYGGHNSVLTLSCDGETAGTTWDWASLDIAADLPVESRPEGFAFDNEAASGLVSSTHADRYLDAADTLAGLAVADRDGFLGCDGDDDACVTSFLGTFGRRAFRRPLTTDELTRYAALVTGDADRTEGIRTAITALLVSPAFLYRSEIGVLNTTGSATLTGWETASAMSYLLWGTMPDDELFRAAEAGELAGVEGREEQARRMLADARARAQVGRFAQMWLGVESVPDTTRNSTLYPGFSPDLADAMLTESTTFAESVVFDGEGTLAALLTSPTSYVNADLAALYGIPAPATEWGEVELPPERGGILGQAAILAAYAHSDQTSPVRRGVFVRERLLCQDLPAPPPNAGSVPTVDDATTTRDRYEQHSDDPACASCHGFIDPIGFGLENYDAVGAWRDTENGYPVDGSGDMTDLDGLGAGTHATFTGAPALGALLAESPTASACFVRQVTRFAHGYVDEDEDCATAGLTTAFAESGGSVVELLVSVVTAPSFVDRE